MLLALIVVAVVAVVLAVLLQLARSSAAEFRAQADRRESALMSERDTLTETNARLERDVEGQRRDVEALRKEKDRLTEHGNQTAAEVRRLGGELDKARAVSAEQTARLEKQSAEIATLTAELETTAKRLEEAEAEAAVIASRDSGIVIGELNDVASQPETLWDLEVTRSERTWRNSVAIDPLSETSPFDDSDDPVRLAVEIEAAALRENVGAFITIEWKAAPIADAARRHLVVRVAQELLEAAARSPEASRLVATGDDEINLSLEAAEEGEEIINIIPPRITNDLIDVRSETGLEVTVKAE